MIAFGPVPSRRLGRSVGVNNIPPKKCTYSCIYCQIGGAYKMGITRREFYEPDHILNEVRKKVVTAKGTIDYLTFVPDGEPTLDVNLGHEIKLLKKLGIKVAVITNSSLMHSPDVREDLMEADLVSVKVDSTQEDVWKRINRPHGKLNINSILNGLLSFSGEYEGKLITETMLVKGVNDSDENVNRVGSFISELKAEKSYLSVPIRPPAEKSVHIADASTINRAYQILKTKIGNVEYLIGYEGNEFGFSGDVKRDILSTTSVHPMRQDAVEILLKQANCKWSVVNELIEQGQLVETEYNKHKFYMRKI
ncbi:MAG: radical SAM protein [Candidatus Aenigmarchaeota archaeon]|nr:radical SAM protein [Candidatus Aenigmarchaeota archaeon]